MVLYIEACESGSMFNKLLPENINGNFVKLRFFEFNLIENIKLSTFIVFVTTASNPDESSYACYYDDLRDTYLGDLYSVNWMEDSERQSVIFRL